jgi:hypothetical protein
MSVENHSAWHNHSTALRKSVPPIILHEIISQPIGMLGHIMAPSWSQKSFSVIMKSALLGRIFSIVETSVIRIGQ